MWPFDLLIFLLDLFLNVVRLTVLALLVVVAVVVFYSIFTNDEN